MKEESCCEKKNNHHGRERKLVELNACGCGTLVEFNVRVEWFLKKGGVKG